MSNGPLRPGDPPRAATLEEVAETVRYALTFGHRGKALGKRAREDLDLVARNAAVHILGSGFSVLKLPPAPDHSTGHLWPKEG